MNKLADVREADETRYELLSLMCDHAYQSFFDLQAEVAGLIEQPDAPVFPANDASIVK